jgi:hypothetical protein
VRKLLRATFIVKRETSITGELWAAFTAAGAASTLAEIANFSRAQPQAISRSRVRACGSECLFMAHDGIPLHANLGRYRGKPDMEQAEFDLAEAANQEEKKKLCEEKQWCCSASRPINGRRSGAQVQCALRALHLRARVGARGRRRQLRQHPGMTKQRAVPFIQSGRSKAGTNSQCRRRAAILSLPSRHVRRTDRCTIASSAAAA